MIIDGRAIAADILARAKARAANLGHTPLVRAIAIAPTPATQSYLRLKTARATDAGLDFATEDIELGRTPGQDIIVAIQKAAERADALIVQLPLPAGFDQKMVCDAIPLAKDADVLSSAAREKFERGDVDTLLPPVVGAIKEIFERNKIDPKGKKAIVIGRGWLVGEPAALWLIGQGARVTTLDSGSKLTEALKDADIIVSGAGSPHLIKPYLIKEDVVLIDAGTSESGGTIAGDADPACAAKCSIFTPVPGGVGPIAVAKLFENAVILAERKVSF